MIKVKHEKQILTADGWETERTSEEEITFDRFHKSFVVEHWTGEERLDYKSTPYGTHHTKTIVTMPRYGNEPPKRAVRTFTFEEKRAHELEKNLEVDTRLIRVLLDRQTQGEISKATGVSQPTLSRIKSGKIKMENVTIKIGSALTEYAKQAVKQ